MPYMPSYLRYALSDQETRHNDRGKEILFRRKKIADLTVNSSAICACDPLVCPETPPFFQKVPTGVFPIHLSIAHVANDQRVGFAALVFSTEPVVHWEMATWPKQNIDKLKSGEVFGYGVDSGTGCFMDTRSSELLKARIERDGNYPDLIIAELDKTQINTWAWAVMELSDNPPANFAVFSTGYGDGLYASYFGFGKDNRPVCLVTDFGIIYEETTVSEVKPTKSSWMF